MKRHTLPRCSASSARGFRCHLAQVLAAAECDGAAKMLERHHPEANWLLRSLAALSLCAKVAERDLMTLDDLKHLKDTAPALLPIGLAADGVRAQVRSLFLGP